MSEKRKDEEFLATMRKRFELSQAAEAKCRDESIDDVRFVTVRGEQWDKDAKARRGNRPCYEFNRLRQHIRQVTGDQRQNRPSIKVRAVEESDKDTAEVMQGLIRNIENSSFAEKAYDTGFEWAVQGGFGVWRLRTKYTSDDSFEQDIEICEITNPFSAFCDPSAQAFDRRDANFWFIVTKMSIDDFKHRYPDEELVNFEGITDTIVWKDEEEILLCEYWYKEYEKDELLLMSNGTTVYRSELTQGAMDAMGNPLSIVKQRPVEVPRVKMALCTGAGVIERADWAGKYIPIVPVYGDVIDIDGERIYSGMVRHGRDAQKVYNFHRTTAIETIANAPKTPYMVTAEEIKGHEALWKRANKDVLPYLIYNPDVRRGGAAPSRSGGVDVPVALIQAAQMDADDIKAVTGQFDAALGARSNETSGRAIMARQREGDTATFSYIDNLSRAIRFTGEILIDLIPKIYDTERVIRVLGVDGGEKWVRINALEYDAEGNPRKLNNLTTGKYDVAVTVGASYTTQRQEAAQTMMEMMQNPQLSPIVADLLAKNLDIPNADELEKRLRKMGIKAGLIEPTEEDLKDGADPVAAMQKQMQEEMQAQLQAMQEQAMELLEQSKAEAESAREKLRALEGALLTMKNDKEIETAKIAIEAGKLKLANFEAETKRISAANEARSIALEERRMQLDTHIKAAKLQQDDRHHDDHVDLERTGLTLGELDKVQNRLDGEMNTHRAESGEGEGEGIDTD